jgi:hypothetical protein
VRPSRRAAVAIGLLVALAAAPTLVREVAPGAAARGWYAATWAPELLARRLPDGLQLVPPGGWGCDPWGKGYAWPVLRAGEHGPGVPAVVSAGPDGRYAYGMGDDLVMPHVETYERLVTGDGRPGWPHLHEVAWWLFTSAPPFALAAACWLAGRRVGHAPGVARLRGRALATLLPVLVLFLGYGLSGAKWPIRSDWIVVPWGHPGWTPMLTLVLAAWVALLTLDGALPAEAVAA